MIEMVHIFGKNLFDLPQMLPYIKELTGIDEVKPFECVGTVDEVNAALHIVISKLNRAKLPLLIDYYTNTTNFMPHDKRLSEKILNEFNTDHFLPSEFLQIIKTKLI